MYIMVMEAVFVLTVYGVYTVGFWRLSQRILAEVNPFEKTVLMGGVEVMGVRQMVYLAALTLVYMIIPVFFYVNMIPAVGLVWASVMFGVGCGSFFVVGFFTR